MSAGDRERPDDPRVALLERAVDAALFGERRGAGASRGGSRTDAGTDRRLEHPFEHELGHAFEHESAQELEREIEAFEAAIATVALSRLPRETPPPALLARLHGLAARESAPGARPAPRGHVRPTRVPDAARWTTRWTNRLAFAAAAGFAIGALTTLAVVSTRTASEVDPSSFLATRPASLRCAWSGTEDPHVVGAVDGAMLFDPTTGDGLIVVSGLAPNDPSKERYQLWIFDEARDERYPVDGGVFDVDGRAPTAAIPVRAKLPVAKPTLFAVTVEKPGGAVVSDRRIALLARPESSDAPAR